MLYQDLIWQYIKTQNRDNKKKMDRSIFLGLSSLGDVLSKKTLFFYSFQFKEW